MIEELWKREQDFISRYADIRISLPAGGMTLGDYQELDCLVRKHAKEGMRIAELGCWVGVSTALLSTIAKEYGGSVTCVDSFSGRGSNLEEAASLLHIRRILEKNLSELKLRNSVMICESDTISGAAGWVDSSFDVVFIDADHRYHAVKNDIEAWWPKVKPGGLMCGHDCEIIWGVADSLKEWDNIDWIGIHPGVVRAVSEAFPNAKKTPNAPIWYVVK